MNVSFVCLAGARALLCALLGFWMGVVGLPVYAQNTFFDKSTFEKPSFGQSSVGGANPAATAKTVVTTPHVRAELLAYAPDGIKTGRTFWLGLRLVHQPQWHTYWKNPGDSGMATQLEWSLPAGMNAGAIAWPVPKKIPVAHLANYGYEDNVLLVTPIHVSDLFQAQVQSNRNVTLRLNAKWLACKTECIPEEGAFEIQLPIDNPTVSTRAFFTEAQSYEPKPHTGTATFSPAAQSLTLLVLGLPDSWRGKQLEVFPEMPEIIENASKVEQSWVGDQWTASIKLSSYRTQTPSEINWVIKIAGTQPFNPSLRLTAKLDGVWQAAVPAKLEASTGIANLNLNATHSIQSTPSSMHGWLSPTFWLAMAGALLGGLLLNFMPCVLPVLAIKLLGFAPSQDWDGVRSVAKVHIEETTGVASVASDRVLNLRGGSGLFALGMVSGFVLLGLALLVLRRAGHDLGWGFQLQSPYTVMALTLLFLLIALNLWGLFEVRVLLPQRWIQWQSKRPSLEALSGGLLAVVIATPCTAPFMGASLGLAIGLPAAQALLIFVALGIGMALPFLLVALHPPVGRQLLKILPKPGPWMVVIRQCLAWPMLASCLWLLWIYAQHTDVQSAFVWAWMLSVLAGIIWALGLPKGALRTCLTVVFFVVLGFSAFLWQSTLPRSQMTVLASGAPASTATEESRVWSQWSPTLQQAAQAQGRWVFVDFTAAWCLTCQVNKSTTLENEAVLAAFKAKNAVLLRADWTHANPDIANALTQLKRSGLPVYALYAPGSSQPQLLPEVLTPAIVLEALAR